MSTCGDSKNAQSFLGVKNSGKEATILQQVFRNVLSKGRYFCIFFFLTFWPHHIACGILVPHPGIRKGGSLNH